VTSIAAMPSGLPLALPGAAPPRAAPPRAADEAAARRFVAELRARLPSLPAGADALLAAIGGNSPYLSDLALRDPAVTEAILLRGPDVVCDGALHGLSALKPATARRDMAAAMRQAKRHVALATAMADIGGAWTLEQVTGALSDLADTALRVATAHLLHHAHARGELRLPHPEAPDRGSGFAVLAMGKLGAHELNYSSDVDLVLLYDPAIHEGLEDGAGHVFARMARELSGLMEARDAGGYVFRVDLRLRPDPASTPPAIALPGALAYYEGSGQTWERAALIKARPVAGDLALGRRFLEAIRPFIWRRHLDFAAIADIMAMKRRIDAHKGTALGEAGPPETRLLGHDLKLGQGGIREVEFCAQTLQLVWGGRTPGLRAPGTLAALRAEAGQRHLPCETVTALEAAYRFLRRAEHRLQMVADRQTHSLPATPDGLSAFARFMGAPDAAAFAGEALGHLTTVRDIFANLFVGGAEAPDTPAPAAPVAAPAALPDPGLAEAWLAGRPRALRTERSRLLLRDMLPAIQAAIARQPDPRAALARLDEFMYRLPAGVQVFSMLHHNPALLERVADVLGAAPALADHLAAFPAALEGLVAPEPIDRAPEASLAARLRDAAGLDDAMAIAGRMVRAEEFAIAVAEFFGRIDVDEAAAARTALADAVIGALLRHAMADHESRYGRIRGGHMAVVALGKLGSGEMMMGSDLDLMLVYDHPPDAGDSRGGRPLSPSQYFGRAAQGFVAALTMATRHGPLYAVDMRLRPSGHAGPVAVSLAGFRRYHAESAWTWERLALTRARVIAAPPKLRREVEAAIGAALRGARPDRVLPDTAAMRDRLLRELPPANGWDVKRRPGGLIEVEFIAQALQLLQAGRAQGQGGAAGHDGARPAPGPARPRGLAIASRPVTTAAHLHRLAGQGALPAGDAAMLVEADRVWRMVQSLLRIAAGRGIPAALPAPVLEKLLRATGFGPDEAGLRSRLDAVAAQVQAAFIRHIGENKAR
jgi:glutamate-ammonia-ligase adenylyltransferase